MDLLTNRTENDFEFWPVEHPIEPLDDDRPVKCPIPESSVINDGSAQEERSSESLRKRAELSAVANKEGMVEGAAEPPVRAVRKRHHTLTRGDHSINPLLQMPLLHPLSTENIAIFHMFQQFK